MVVSLALALALGDLSSPTKRLLRTMTPPLTLTTADAAVWGGGE